MTGERNTYVTSDEAHRYAVTWAAYVLHEGAPRPALDVKLGVLVPDGMVAVNPDDLAAVVSNDWPKPPAVLARLRAVVAASNPTTEKPDA